MLKAVRQHYYQAAYVRSAASSPHECPVCGQGLRKFMRSRWGDSVCCVCRSHERHRLVWLFFQRQTNLFDGRPKSMLHVAAEEQFQMRLGPALGAGYLTADLLSPRAMVRMDITDIQYPGSHFDVIYCSHVLEHVPDDRAAMREFARVLKPDGWSVLLVPIFGEKTFEDPAVTSPQDRLRVFGQEDHVRIYGPDFADRLVESGMEVRKFLPTDFLSVREMARFDLTALAGDIFLCKKRTPPGGVAAG